MRRVKIAHYCFPEPMVMFQMLKVPAPLPWWARYLVDIDKWQFFRASKWTVYGPPRIRELKCKRNILGHQGKACTVSDLQLGVPEWVSAPWTAPAFAWQQAAGPSRAVFCVLMSPSWITDDSTGALDLLIFYFFFAPMTRKWRKHTVHIQTHLIIPYIHVSQKLQSDPY